jgi:DNA repair protein SbcD/Mre11
MSIRFLHTADLHLDSPFAGLSGDVPENVSSRVREATLLAWVGIVDLALEERVDFVVVAGDVFDRENRSLLAQVRFRDGLARLAGAGIPSFVVTGNHDPLSGWEATIVPPALAHRFPAGAVTAQPVLRDGVEIARVYGVSFSEKNVTANLAATFSRETDAPFAVGLLHANVGNQDGYDNYAPCSLADLRASGMDYWALGHVHRPRVLSDRDPVALYSGSPQGRDPGEADPRGVYVVTVDSGGRVVHEFRPTDVVRWRLLDVPIGGIGTEDALLDRLIGAVEEARVEAGRSIVARVTLTGRGPLHATLRRAGVLDETLRYVREQFRATDRFAWVESLRDATRAEIDVASRREAGDFLGDVLRSFESTRRTLVVSAASTDAADAGAVGADTADTAGDRAEDGHADGGVPVTADELDAALDPLFAHRRARRYLRDVRPDAARLADLLGEAEQLVLDRLGGEG